jgi:hypothetical protein
MRMTGLGLLVLLGIGGGPYGDFENSGNGCSRRPLSDINFKKSPELPFFQLEEGGLPCYHVAPLSMALDFEKYDGTIFLKFEKGYFGFGTFSGPSPSHFLEIGALIDNGINKGQKMTVCSSHIIGLSDSLELEYLEISGFKYNFDN